MHSRIYTFAAPFAVSLMLASRISAQPRPAAPDGPTMAAARVGVRSRSERSVFPAHITSYGTASTDTRSAVLAVGMSAVVPGAGSLYAGNARHGIIHMAVATASVLTIVGVAGSCSFWLNLRPECDSEERVMNVAAVGFAVNYVWSIVSAVRDAKAYNSRHRAAP